MTTAGSRGPSREDRYTAARPCPVCGGWESMPRGEGRRCDGYALDGGAYCARVESPKRHPSADLFFHRVNGEKAPSRPSRREVAAYDYVDEHGARLFQAVRFDPKGFAQRVANDDGSHTWTIKGVRLVLYRLPELVAALEAGDAVYVVEGEKDADAVHAAGAVATCNAMGAGKWRPEYAETLRGAADVRIVADRDEPGYRHAAHVAAALRNVGARVTVLEPVVGKDVSDHLAAGRTLDELVEIDPAAKLEATATNEEAEPPPSRLAVDRVGFSGAPLLALLERPAPDPIYSAIPPRGHFTCYVAPAFSGKTSLELWLAMAYAKGCAPWQGAPILGPGRVLIYSLDEAPEQVARRMNGLAIFHPAGPLARYADNLVVIGPDRETDPTLLESLRFDDTGLGTLSRWLEAAGAEGRPFVAVFVDAYADVLPLGESENSNEEGTRIGGALERLAVRHGPAIALLHHAGKPRQDAKDTETDVRFLGRGASALAAKARTIFSLEQVAGMSHLRRVRAATNLGRAPKPALFEVCSPESGTEELLYFKPGDVATDRRAADLLRPGIAISTNDLARLLAGESFPEDREPPGEMKRSAAQLRERWREAGLVTVTPGPKGSKMIELVHAGEPQ